MPFFIISLIIQVAFVLHVIKTGRNTTWIWIVVMLPMAGSIAYFVMEILPDLLGSKTGRKAKSNLAKIVNPNKDINAASRQFAMSGSVDSSIKLAAECIKKGLFDEARELYRSCLKGIHEHDPEIMHGLAFAEFNMQNFTETKRVLDDLIEKNPAYKNAEAHLLYARTLEEMNENDLALHEYEVLDNYFTGPEASFRYALLLKKIGDHQKSQEMLKRILHKAEYSGNHYNSLYKEWIKKAKIESER